MENILAPNGGARSYVFPVELTLEADGRWSATCPALPGCATWARNRADAVRNIQEAVEVYVEDMLATGEPLPQGVRVAEGAVVAVTV